MERIINRYASLIPASAYRRPDLFAKCPWCNSLYRLDKEWKGHSQDCQGDSNTNVWCYTCPNMGPQHFSSSQLTKEYLRRCRECVRTNNQIRFPRYLLNDVHTELMEAIGDNQLQRVKKCLERGADPNYIRQTDQHLRNRHIPLYKRDGTHKPGVGLCSSFTPLKLVAFRLCDCTLTPEEDEEYYQITYLLLQSGANPVPLFIDFIYGDDHFFEILKQSMEECDKN